MAIIIASCYEGSNTMLGEKDLQAIAKIMDEKIALRQMAERLSLLEKAN